LGHKDINPWGKSKSGCFYTPRRFFLPTVKKIWGKKKNGFSFTPKG